MDALDRLKREGVRARKDLGQHFLVDPGAVRRILDAAALSKTDTVVEVGPGPGVLTTGLAERSGRVLAIEIDERMVKVLGRLKYPNLTVRQGDVLGIDLAELPRPYKVVANVPYYITSAITKHFLETPHRPTDMTLTIQAEVAERIVAEPPKMSVLAVSVRLYGEPRIAGRIKRTAFRPAPAVDSAILRIEDIGTNLREKLQGLSESDFFRVVKAGFAEKRKQVHNSLTRNLAMSPERVAAILETAGIDPARRAETLTVEEWVRVGNAHGNNR